MRISKKIENPDERRRLFFLEIIFKTSIVSYFFYTIFYSVYSFTLFFPAIVAITIYLVANIPVFILLKKGYYDIARVLVLLTINITMFYLVFFVFGTKPYLQIYFILFTLIGPAVWPIDKKFWPGFFFILNLLLYVAAEFFLKRDKILVEFPDKILVFFQITNVVVGVGATFYIIWISMNLSQKKESELQEQKNILHQKNIKLQLSKEQIESHKNDLDNLNHELQTNLEVLHEKREELIIANATKDKFISIIAHDIKNPLFGFIGLLEWMNKNIDKYDINKIKEQLKLVYDSSQHLKALVVDLLNWARTQTSGIVVNPIQFSLYTEIEYTLLVLNNSIVNKELHVEIIKNEDIYVFADKEMVRVVIRNILSNAIKYTPRNGLITITITEDDLFGNIIIKDSGVGMDSNHINNLFKLEKVQSYPGTEHETGSGLGLLICNEFIKINNGQIIVESVINEGSTFSIKVPKSITV